MKRLIFFLIVYSILVLLGGTMSFWHAGKISSLFFEILGGALLFLCLYFLIKKKNIAHLFIFAISSILLFFYGYFFYMTNGFFEAIMAAISAFIAFSNVMEYLK